MNSIEVIITEIQSVNTLNLVRFDCKGEVLEMMSLDLADGMGVGSKVKVAVKPTHIALAKNIKGVLSHPNQLEATVASIEEGILLSSVLLHVRDEVLEVIVTQASLHTLDLHVKDKVYALINASELSIVEVLDD